MQLQPVEVSCSTALGLLLKNPYHLVMSLDLGTTRSSWFVDLLTTELICLSNLKSSRFSAEG